MGPASAEARKQVPNSRLRAPRRHFKAEGLKLLGVLFEILYAHRGYSKRGEIRGDFGEIPFCLWKPSEARELHWQLEGAWWGERRPSSVRQSEEA